MTTHDRFPLSRQQELWCAAAPAGTFGPHWVVTNAVRLTGTVDVAALQDALDDVAARHEILRTVVIRDADPPCQEVHPPCQVPLRVEDLPPAADRDEAAARLVHEARLSPLYVEELPVLRAILHRFDDRDAVLTVLTHHTVADGWSIQLIMRDLAAAYATRTAGHAPELPPARPYHEFVAQQREELAMPDVPASLAYWRRKLDGARWFTLPTDRPVPATHTKPYSAWHFTVDGDIMTGVTKLAKATRASRFMVLLAAFNVLAHQITGTVDPVVNTLTYGRNEPQFHATVGPFLNFLPMRTEIGDCASFREIIGQTRQTCLDAYAHELPVMTVEAELPDLQEPLADNRNCDFIFGLLQPLRMAETTIAEGTSPVARLTDYEPVSSWMPGGAAWTMMVRPTGQLIGSVQFNVEEFDPSTIAGWVANYRTLLTSMVAAPEQAWTTFANRGNVSPAA